MINPYLTDPCTNAKLTLTDFSISVSIYQHLTVTYQYLINAYIIKSVLTDPDQYLISS